MPIKLQILSDIHNEFSGYRWNIPKTDADIIILAGDIGNGLRATEWCIRQSEKLHKPIIYILGNHEFYGEDFSLYEKAKKYSKGTHVHVLERDIFEYNGYRFLGTSLWTDFMGYGEVGKVHAMLAARQFMADYKYINNGNIHPEDTVKLFRDSYTWLRTNLGRSTKDIVITHHLPNHYGLNPRYKGDVLNPAFFSDLEGFIIERQPRVWISGHSHWSYSQYIGNTLCIANTKGYRSEEGQIGFDPKLIIEV